MNILIAFVIVAVLAGVLAVALAAADRKFKIEKDERLEKLEGIMPGANCGGCGFAGCNAYAEAVSKGEAKIGLCSPGGKAVADRMAEIMGQKAEEVERKVAFVFCNGSPDKTKSVADYGGIRDCNAASVVFNGAVGCKSGCMHFGSCAAICPEKAISKDTQGNYIVDKDKCIGCGKCVSVCPNHVIRLIPYDADYVVACNNKENGAKVTKVCSAGCIGCKICVNKFSASGCKMDEFLSVVDYSADHSQIREAAAACPRKIIIER